MNYTTKGFVRIAREAVILLFKIFLVIAIVFVFLMAYAGFIYIELDGVIPSLTLLYSSIVVLIGLIVGVKTIR